MLLQAPDKKAVLTDRSAHQRNCSQDSGVLQWSQIIMLLTLPLAVKTQHMASKMPLAIGAFCAFGCAFMA